MIFDTLQIILLGGLAYLTYQQNQRIDDLEMMVGYILGNLDSERQEDVLSDYEA